MREALTSLAEAIRTSRFRRWPHGTMTRACDIAAADDAETVEAEHLLLAMTQHADDSAAHALSSLNMTEGAVRHALDAEFADALQAAGLPNAPASRGMAANRSGAAKPKWGHSATLVLTRALQAAADEGQRRVRDRHLLFALGRAEAGIIPPLLATLGVSAADIETALH